MKRIQHIRKSFVVALTGLLLTISFFAICVSFLFPGKIRVVDDLRFGIMESSLNMLEKLEKTGQRMVYENFRSQNSTLSFADLLPYLNDIEPGTVFFISHGKTISNIIPGNWSHAGFYLGTQKQVSDKFGPSSEIYNMLAHYYRNGYEHLIIDSSLKKGCAVRDISEMSSMSSESTLRSILCFEPKISTGELKNVLQNSLAETGKKYDLSFLIDDPSKIYCTELIYDAFQTLGIKIEKRTQVFFRDILLPEDMVQDILQKHLNDFKIKLCLVKNGTKVKDLNTDEIIGLITGFLYENAGI